MRNQWWQGGGGGSRARGSREGARAKEGRLLFDKV